MANGKVITGFSKPYVALYSSSGGTVTYSSGMPLARGVNVSVEADSSDGTNFYADNVTAETAGGVFTGATVTLTVDGLKAAARTLIMGLPAASTITYDGNSVNVYDYDDRQTIPYVGIGFIVRYMENGNTTYAPVVFTKAAFKVDGLDANTQEDEIEFQTTELEATIMRDDSTNHTWRRIVEDQTSETAAEGILQQLLNVTASV